MKGIKNAGRRGSRVPIVERVSNRGIAKNAGKTVKFGDHLYVCTAQGNLLRVGRGA